MSSAIDVLLADGDLPDFTRIGGGVEVVAQRIRFRLATHFGEWRLDNRVGMPFLTWSQIKPPPLDSIAAKTRREIEAVPGVVRVDALSAEHDTTSRRVTVSGTVLTEEGVVTLKITPLGSPESGNRNPAILLWNAAGSLIGG